MNFMMRDIAGSLVATLVFAALLYAPGYVVAYSTDLFGFRTLRLLDRSVWAVACSFAVVPIVAYFAGRFAELHAVCWGMAAFSVAALWLLWQGRRAKGAAPPLGRRDRWLIATVIGGWIVFALLMLVDFQVGHRLFFSVAIADQSYRIAFTDAVVRTGVPPANPLYFSGHPAPMAYYYFWYVLAAAVVPFAHVSTRQSFIASSIWAGLGLLALVRLYATHFFRWPRQRQWLAVGLLAVTGADLLPSLGNAVLQPSLNGDIEWWSVDPIDAWPDSLLWVPHHVASVICCLLALLFLWRTFETPTKPRRRALPLVLAAFAFASGFGLSVYVAFGFALLIALWLVWAALHRSHDTLVLCKRFALVSAMAASLLLPFLQELTANLPHEAPGPGAGPPTHLFGFSVRQMIDSGLLTGLPLFSRWNNAHPLLLDQGMRLLLLLPGLAMELGLYGAVLVWLLRARMSRSAEDRDARRRRSLLDTAPETALFFVVSGLLMTMFLGSSVISNNDFGYRAVMLPQFFLTLLTADVLGAWWFSANRSHPGNPLPSRPPLIEPTRGRRRLATILFALGIAGSLYGALLLRGWLPFEAAHAGSGFGQLPEDALEIREASAQLARVSSADAVVAFRPIDDNMHPGQVMSPNEFYQRLLVMNVAHPFLNAEGKCAVHFGGDRVPCSAIQRDTAQLYALPAPTAQWAQAYCSRFGVQYLLLSHLDPDWHTPNGWPATLPTLAAEPGFQILRCSVP